MVEIYVIFLYNFVMWKYENVGRYLKFVSPEWSGDFRGFNTTIVKVETVL